MPSYFDIKAVVAGAAGWAAAIPIVMYAGPRSNEASSAGAKAAALALGVGIAAVTTPTLSYLLGWKTREEKLRGVALGIGAAQVLDGLVHVAYPKFYANDAADGLACASSIFWAAGLTGILSCYQ